MHTVATRHCEDPAQLVERYGNMLFRIALVIMGREPDAEDAVQETLLKYLQKAPAFENGEHEKAWLITVVTNQCRDLLRHRQHEAPMAQEGCRALTIETPDSAILEALMAVPEKFRLVLTLYYVEEYSIEQIADIIQRTPSAVKMRLKKGRALLEEIYRKEYL